MTIALPPPPPFKRLTALVAALAALMLSLPAAAQDDVSFHHAGGGTSHSNPLARLTVLRSGNEAARNLKIKALDWPATALFGVGSDSRCAGDDSGRQGAWVKDSSKVTQLNPDGWTWRREGTAKLLVGFHRASDRYTGGQPIARRCTYWEEGRFKPHTGMFTVRIYGKACLKGPTNAQRCWDLSSSAPPPGWIIIARLAGYEATFAHGENCGPPQTIPQREHWSPHAAWCDFTVELK